MLAYLIKMIVKHHIDSTLPYQYSHQFGQLLVHYVQHANSVNSPFKNIETVLKYLTHL